MTRTAYPIDRKLSERLRSDPSYRRTFLDAESSAKIASDLILLRKRRGLTQKQLAELTHTAQPAISRAERADYHNRSFSVLRAIAGVLDARIRVIIEAAEDILWEYEETDQLQKAQNAFGGLGQSEPRDGTPLGSIAPPYKPADEQPPPGAFTAGLTELESPRQMSLITPLTGNTVSTTVVSQITACPSSLCIINMAEVSSSTQELALKRLRLASSLGTPIPLGLNDQCNLWGFR